MDPSQFKLFDAKRFFIGQQPATFLIEIVFRALITYLLLLVAARMLGKRVAGQMSVLELTIIVTLGAAIGVPLEVPERGIIPAVIVLLVAVLYQRATAKATVRSRKAGRLLEGHNEAVVRDGRIEVSTLSKLAISRERLYALLRQLQVLELGEVKRAYLEANGQLTVLKLDKPPPGLAILPPPDRESYEQRFAEPSRCACRSCGNVAEDGSEACEHCGEHDWAPAVRKVEISEI